MADVLVTLHQGNAYLVVTCAAIVGIWGLILYFRKKEIIKPWRIGLLVVVVLGLLQAVLGLTMLLLGLRPGGGGGPYQLHFVYGGLVALAIPLAYISYATGGKNPRRDLLIYSIAVIIVAAAGVRGLMTGH